MTTAAAWGLILGTGLALVVTWFGSRTATLAQRIAPHVRASEAEEVRRRSQPVTPFPTLERLLAPVLRDGARWLERWGSPTHEVRGRLRRAGAEISVEQFRAQQVVWALVGTTAGTAGALAVAASRNAAPMSLLVMIVASAVAGAVARDYWLQRAVEAREARIVAELPTVAELLALAVSAGEGALGALERVARTARGAMSYELNDALAAVRAGAPLTTALGEMASGTGVLALRRFADGVATAVERGTPLAEVLRAQAQDVRAAGQRALMEEGGKKEIAMMVPVVFLILPVTVIFAVFPGLAAIQIGL